MSPCWIRQKTCRRRLINRCVFSSSANNACNLTAILFEAQVHPSSSRSVGFTVRLSSQSGSRPRDPEVHGFRSALHPLLLPCHVIPVRGYARMYYIQYRRLEPFSNLVSPCINSCCGRLRSTDKRLSFVFWLFLNYTHPFSLYQYIPSLESCQIGIWLRSNERPRLKMCCLLNARAVEMAHQRETNVTSLSLGLGESTCFFRRT